MHTLLDWILAISTILYASLLMAYRYWFGNLHYFKAAAALNSNLPSERTRFSVVIAARNEAENIKICIETILAQNYSTDFFEIIVIDDFSEDLTAAIVKKMQEQHTNLHLLNMADYFKPNEIISYKKKAIEIGVQHAKGNWIVTTDADCIIPPNWLLLFDQYIHQYQPVFVAAPVMFIKERGLLNQFQLLDFLALQGITAAAVAAGKHSMCNGANLAFEKSAFIAVGGYQGVDQIASGDDMFLMHKMKLTLSNRIGYLFHPDAIVLTQAMQNWKGFLMQRIRWSTKALFCDDRSIFWVLVLVFVFNFSFLLLLLMGHFGSLLIALAFKTFFELFFLEPVAKFYNLQSQLSYFLLYQPVHITYTILAGLFWQVKTYTWKGRRVK